MRRQLCFLLISIAAISPVYAGDKVEKERLPKHIKVTVEAPKDVQTLDDVNSGKYAITWTIENRGTEDVQIWPFMYLSMKDGNGKYVKPIRFETRWAKLSKPSVIEEVQSLTLARGKKYIIEVKLNAYASDPDVLTGWKIKEPGEYVVVLNYLYTLDIAKSYGRGCKDFENKDAPWNRALELWKYTEVKLTVKK